MKPVQKILAAIDLSERSLETVRFAADLARRYEASLTILHVYQSALQRLPDGQVFAPPLQPTAPPEAVQQLAAAKREALDAGVQHVETSLVLGAASAEIVHLAGERGYDLIVIGTQPRHGLDHLLFGSVAETVLRTAPCPLVSIRHASAEASRARSAETPHDSGV